MGALARRAAGAVGHRHEARSERLQPLHRRPEPRLHLRRLGREELEGDQRRHRAGTQRLGGEKSRGEGHDALAKAGASVPASAAMARRAGQRATVSGVPGRSRAASGSRPASRHHAVTSASVKPRRRWACSLRRNSSACGREIDDQQSAAGSEHACSLGDDVARTLGIMQHLVDHRRVEGRARQRQLVHVALADRAVAELRALEIDPRHRQHLAREIDADGPLDPRREDLEHAPGAGADVEEVADTVSRKERGERRLDLALLDIERADPVPLRGVGAEIGPRLRLALTLDGGEAFAIEGERRILAWQEVGQEPRQRAAAAAAAPGGRTPSSLRGSGRAGRPRRGASSGATPWAGFAPESR